MICNISKFVGEEYLDPINEAWDFLSRKFKKLKPNEKIIIFSTESGCFEYIGLFDILDTLCDIFNVKKEQIELRSPRHGATYSRYKHRFITAAYDFLYFQHREIEYIYNEKFKGCCLFGRANSSRLYLWHALKNNKDFQLNFHQDFNKVFAAPTIKDFLIGEDISYKKLQETFPIVEIGNEVLQPPIVVGKNNDHEFFNNVYKNYALEIVAETSPMHGKGYFFTEKSFRPLYYGIIPLIHSKPNCLKYFRRLGFDLFEDIVPTWYDEFSGRFRAEAIVDIANSVKISSKLYKSLIPRFKYNTQKVLEIQKLYKEKYPYERLLLKRN